MKIAYVGFGEAARAFTETLLKRQPDLKISAYDILLDSDVPEKAVLKQAVKDQADRLGVALGATVAEAVGDADWVISAVTAASSLEAAKSVIGKMRQGSIFIDLNSVSGARKTESAKLIEETGVRYVDMAVMAPVHPRGHATPVLLAGLPDENLFKQFIDLGFSAEIAGPTVGQATSIKMVRSLFVKGLEAITVQAMMAAKAAGCYDEVLASLEKSHGALGWPEFASYNFERVGRHGVRRAAEMRESSATMADLGFEPGARLAAAVADIQEGVAGLKLTAEELDRPLDEVTADAAKRWAARG